MSRIPGKPRGKYKIDTLDNLMQFRTDDELAAQIDAARKRTGETRSQYFRRVVSERVSQDLHPTPRLVPTPPTED